MRGKMDAVEKSLATKRRIPRFEAGDTVEAHVRVREGDKERIQVFEGIVISRRGTGTNASFLVRKVVQGEGIERVFPIHSPGLAKIVVKKRGRTRRAKLYYLRERTGRAARVREVFGPATREEEKLAADDEPTAEEEKGSDSGKGKDKGKASGDKDSKGKSEAKAEPAAKK